MSRWEVVLILCVAAIAILSAIEHDLLLNQWERDAQSREERIIEALNQKCWTRSIEGMTLDEKLTLVRLLVEVEK